MVNDEEELAENINIKARLYNANINIIFKGKYEFGLDYLYNTQFINGYMLPYRGSYNHFYFKYHLKERKNFPLNMSFNIKYGECASYTINDKYTFNLRSHGIGIYKEIKLDTYPIIPSIDYQIYSTFYKNIPKDEFNIITLSVFIKLIVKTKENTPSRDIIWLQPNMKLIEDDQIFGFNIGLYHPIK